MALECATHKAFIYDRGGMRVLWPLDGVVKVTWGRLRDGTSEADVSLKYASAQCMENLQGLRGMRHELVVFRDGKRVWEGPVTRVTWRTTEIDIHARDISHYIYRTVMHAGYNNGGVRVDTVLNRVWGILHAELARKEAPNLDPPINVLPHLDFRHFPDDARTARVTLPRESTVFEDFDTLAHRGGVDYVVVGRSLKMFDTHRNLGVTPMVSESDFIGETIVTEYAMDLVSEMTVTGRDGMYGLAGGVDPYYGWVEVLHSAYDEESDDEAPSQEALNSQALRNLAGRNPAPIEVRVPDASQVNPLGVLGIEHMVPGVRVPLRATLGGKHISQMQKLDVVKVTEEAESGEKITITLSPASINDEEVEE